MAAFLDDLIFPVAISRGSAGGPIWKVDITELSSGHEERNSPWSSARREYDLRWTRRSKDERYVILQTYLVAGGALCGFRLLDQSDHMSCAPSATPAPTDQPLGIGDGVTTSFALSKVYQVGIYSHSRRIHKPFGALLVATDGVAAAGGWTLDAATGLVSFDVPPAAGAALTWGGYFHTPVRFDSDLSQTVLSGDFDDIPSIMLKELRL